MLESDTVRSTTRSGALPALRRPITISLDSSLRVAAADRDLYAHLRPVPAEEVCGTPFCDLLDPATRPGLRARLEELVAGGPHPVRDVPITLVTRSGGLCGELGATTVSCASGRFDGVVVQVCPPRVSARGRQGRSSGTTAHSTCSQTLSATDVRILEGIASGASTVELAAAHFLSRGGIEYHITSLMRALKVKNRPALVSRAYSLGLFEAGAWPPRVTGEHLR